MNTDLEITLEFLDSPTEVDFFAVAGAPGRDGQDGADGAPGRDGADGHTPVITASKTGKRTTVYVDGSAVAQIDDGADGQDGEDGQDGHSPVITASKSSGVTTISVDGVAVATISDGVDGQDGAKGDSGAAGHSPVVTASKSGKVTTVSVDGSPIATINDGEDGQDGQDGSDGQDGFSPSASVSKSGSTATITVTDKNGTTTATVSDGQDGADGQDGHTPVKGTDYWTAADKAEIVAEAAGAVDVPVTDVQVEGASIVSDGVAAIPRASHDRYGAIRTSGAGSGLWYYKGKLQINFAGSETIKNGVIDYNSLTPYHQHESTFYGLAKAAGDSTQSASSNTVGNYTDAAKDKILQMLGIDELIAQHEGAQSTHAYAANDVFIYEGKLYKATTAIAINDAIAPNVNCVQTTLINLIRGI